VSIHLEVGRRIRQAREDCGLSQAELGQLLRRPRTHAAISDIERGKTRLDVEELTELAAVLKQPLLFFLKIEPTATVYRRGDQDLTSDQQRETDASVEDFKRFARERLRRDREG